MKKFRDYAYTTVGMMILGAGVALCDAAALGTDPLSVFVKGISIQSGLSLGVANAIVSLCMVVVALALDRRNVTFATLLSAFSSSLGIDLMASILPVTSLLWLRVVYMILGILLYTLGAAMSQIRHIGYNTYDVFIYGLERLIGIDRYRDLRWISDGTAIVIGLILGGRAWVATVLILLFAGVLVEGYTKLLMRGEKDDREKDSGASGR